MIGLLRRGDDGLTGWGRRRAALRYERTLGATPSADVFARARARHLASRALAPSGYVPAPQGAGPDAAAPEVTPLTGRPPKPSGAACSAPDGNAAEVGPSSAGGACGRDAQASPAVPCLACGADSAPGDDLCRSHGGMTDGIERHAAMRAA